MKSLLKFLVLGIISLAIFGCLLWIVNSYIYSWSSFFLLGCNYKYITVFSENEKKLEQNYNLTQIYNEIKTNPQKHKLECWLKNGQLGVSQQFDELTYFFRLEEMRDSSGYYIKVHFGNTREDSVKHGEPRNKPDYQIRQNINQMIDEMPLNDAQKQEIKSKVSIVCGGGRMPS